MESFSDTILPLAQAEKLPLDSDAELAFNNLKQEVESAVLYSVDNSTELQLETDASDFALSAVLNQNGRPVAFFSRMLKGPELGHSSVEKEAAAIVEVVKHWTHFLSGRHFKLVTD